MRRAFAAGAVFAICLCLGACGGGSSSSGSSSSSSSSSSSGSSGPTLVTLSQYTPADGSTWVTACRPVDASNPNGSDSNTFVFNSGGTSLTFTTNSYSGNNCTGTNTPSTATVSVTLTGTLTDTWYAYSPNWGTVPTYTSLGYPASVTASKLQLGGSGGLQSAVVDNTDPAHPLLYVSNTLGTKSADLYYNQLSTFKAAKQ